MSFFGDRIYTQFIWMARFDEMLFLYFWVGIGSGIKVVFGHEDAFEMYHYGSVALLSHFDKVLALSKFALLKCENEVNP